MGLRVTIRVIQTAGSPASFSIIDGDGGVIKIAISTNSSGMPGLRLTTPVTEKSHIYK
jgi:hypothetical protein